MSAVASLIVPCGRRTFRMKNATRWPSAVQAFASARATSVLPVPVRDPSDKGGRGAHRVGHTLIDPQTILTDKGRAQRVTSSSIGQRVLIGMVRACVPGGP